MAGRTSQTTAAAPAPTPAPSVPAAVIATGNTESPSSPPPAPTPQKQDSKPKATKVAKAPGMALGVENAPNTSDATQAQFESELRDWEEKDATERVQEGKAEKTGKEKAPALKAADKDKAKVVDPLQAELDEVGKIESGEATETEVAKDDSKKEEVDAEKEKEAEEVEPPDPENEKDEYETWINSLSKPAKKRIEQYRKQLATTKATASERIVLNPTIEAPLSHITNLEQLDAEKAYWSNIRTLAKSGEPFVIKGADGKKLELDPEIEADAKVISTYTSWAEAALEAVPDAKERIKTRASSKPWEQAEKLSPGMISDKDSFANKKAVEILRANPSMTQDPNYEVHLGHMVRSYQMDEDAKPTAEFPKGKAMWKRVPLDKEGKAVFPKQAVASKDAGKKPPTAVDSKPAAITRNTEASKATYQKAEETRDHDDWRNAVAAEFGQGR